GVLPGAGVIAQHQAGAGASREGLVPYVGVARRRRDRDRLGEVPLGPLVDFLRLHRGAPVEGDDAEVVRQEQVGEAAVDLRAGELDASLRIRKYLAEEL